MNVNYQNREVVLGPSEWITVILPDGEEVTVQGDGHVYARSGAEYRLCDAAHTPEKQPSDAPSTS